MRVALALVSAVIVAAVLSLDLAGAVSDPYSGKWDVASAGGTPWANGGTLVITKSSSPTVGSTGEPQFDTYARGYCTGPPPPGGTPPKVSAWYRVKHSWNGGGRMGGCVSDKTNGQLIFFGSRSMGAARGADGETIGGYWTNDPNSQDDYTATIAVDEPGPGGGDVTGCAGSARIACTLPFGRTARLPAPDPGEPTDISSARLPANTKGVDVNVELTDAEIDQFLATLALVKKRVVERETEETVGACLLFGGTSFDAADLHSRAATVACLRLLGQGAKAARAPGDSAARRCRVRVVPVWRPGSHPSARKQRRAAAAYGRLVRASCTSRRPRRLALHVTARGEGAKLNRLLGRRAHAGLVRSAPRSAKDGPKAKLAVTWRRR